MELKTIATSPEAKAIIIKLNQWIRNAENSVPFEQIRYSLAGWAEYFATEQFDSTVEDIDPHLADLLYKLKSPGRQAVGRRIRPDRLRHRRAGPAGTGG